MLFSLSANAQGKTLLLEKLVTIDFKNEKTGRALERLGNLGGFSFSYSPEVIDETKKITLTLRSKSVREALELIFSSEMAYREKGKHIILTRRKIESGINELPKQIVITGYITDSNTGGRLASATVFDTGTLSAANTDAFGFFSMKIVKPSAPLKIAAFRKGYSDTLTVLPTLDKPTVQLAMRPVGDIPAKAPTPLVPTLAIRDTMLNPVPSITSELSPGKLAMLNISDTLRREYQVGFLPFAGSNGLLSGNVINDYSLNALGGFSMGNEKLELAGLFNVARADVRGVQAAGLFNAAGRSSDAVQLAGVANMSRDTSSGVQLAGVMNVHGSSHSGFLAAGVLNYTHQATEGVSIAGVLNHQNGYADGVQIAGVLNSALSGISALQIAGVLNVAAAEVGAAQLAGVLNTTIGNVNGAQVAGVLNACTGEVRGAQVSAVLNVAKKVRGMQVALINVSDSISGVPVGLLSYVHSGFHSVELSTDETFMINVAFRTGVRSFYNIFGAGNNPVGSGDNIWYYAYGIGGSPRLGRRFNLDIQLTAHWLNYNSDPEFNLLNRFAVGADYKFSKTFSIFAGAQLNGLLTDQINSLPDSVIPDDNDVVYDRNISADYNLKIYPGVRAGLRVWW